MNTLKAFIVAVFFILSAPSYSVESRYSFREIQLGDELHQAEVKARRQFDQVKLVTLDEFSVSVHAGDKEGIKGDCSFRLQSHERPNCLQAFFSTRPDGTTRKVQFMSATQSFNPPISFNALLKRLNETYGTPRVRYKNTKNTAQSSGTETHTLLWGGANTPVAYSQSWSPADDFKLIGGEFVSVEAIVSGTDVIGYRLRIADTGQLSKAEKEYFNQLKVEKERAKAKNAESVKF